MTTLNSWLLSVSIAAVCVWLIWRVASRRQSLPCPVWLRWLVELDNPLTQTNRAHVIISHLDLHAGMKVLDAGCGPGRLTIPLAQQVGPQGEVVAMDIQAGMLQRTQQKAQARRLANIRLLHAGIGDGKLERDYYDRVVLVTVLGEIPQREIAMQEIFTALKPGGLLSVTEIIFDPHFQSRGVVRQLTQAAGFTEQAFFGNRIAYTLQLQKP